MQKPLFLFVYPKVPNTYWSYKHALSFVGKRALMPPLGLATVAAMVPEEYESRIVDLNVEQLPQALIERAELVLISAMIVQAESMRTLIRRCRSAGATVVAGGPYPTSCREEIEGVDHFVLGEAESSFPQFLADYQNGDPLPVYQCDQRPALSAAPIPRFDLLRLDLYDSVPLQFSRGCPFDCEFCDIVHLFGRKPRTKEPEQFVAELDAAHSTGFVGSVFVVDDNFIGNKRAAKSLLRAVAEWQDAHGRPYTLSTEASIDLATDDELLDLMVAAGFSMVFVGIESPEEESLAAAGKLQNLRQDVVESVRKIQEHGIEVTGGFIVGFDSDLPSIFDSQIRFVQKLAIPTAMVGLLTALPNTKLHQRLESEGRLRGTTSGNNTHDAVLNFEPKMDRRTLELGYYRVLSTIYSPWRYFARCLEVLNRYPKRIATPNMRRKIRLRELTGLINSLARQLFSGYGLAYVAYMVRAILRRPDLIVTVVTMAIQGHHYITITRTMMRTQESKTRAELPLGGELIRDTIKRLVPEPSPVT